MVAALLVECGPTQRPIAMPTLKGDWPGWDVSADRCSGMKPSPQPLLGGPLVPQKGAAGGKWRIGRGGEAQEWRWWALAHLSRPPFGQARR